MYFEHPVSPTSNSSAARSLAVGVLELCGLCEELLTLAAARDAAPDSLSTISEQLEAVRATATPLVCQSNAATDEAGDKDYSLSALGLWVWRE